MQVFWIAHDKSNLLSLGNPKTLSFPGDTGVGGGPQVSWKASDPVITQAASNDSSSSAMISQSNGRPEEKVSCENSDQSGSILKEHDYMGMADISSASPLKSQFDTDNSQELNLRETHLCLGLGLGLAPSANAELVKDTGKTIAFTFSQQETKTLVDPSNNSAKYAFIDGAAGQQSVQTSWPSAAAVRTITVENSIPSDSQAPQICLPIQEFGSSRAGAPCVPNVFPGTSVVVPTAALKNGLKRGYTEAMSDPTRFNMSSESAMVGKNGDVDVKSLPKHHPQSSFLPSWAPSKSMSPTAWHVAPEQSAGLPFGANDKPVSVLIAPRVEKPVVDCAAAAYKGNQSQPQAPQESATNEAPPSKGQVVGWPPIRSYRKNTLAKPTEMFVKVNMDGVTVGRKVDLNAHNCYEGLLSALEEMFQPSSSAQGASQAALGNDSKQFRLLNGSDFVLTYEDKDGDWMLVGDVPWSMFTNAVRRLRITRAPEATSLGPRKLEKHK